VVEILYLEAREAEPFCEFTYPATLKFLTEPVKWRRAIVGALDDDVPVGLAFGLGENELFELMSVYVTPLLRRQGIGRRLLAAVERYFCEADYKRAWHHFTVPADDPGAARFLLRCGWSKPVVRQVVCTTDLTHASGAPWLASRIIPSGYSIIRWRSLGNRERAAMRARQAREVDLGAGASTTSLELLDPFLYEKDCQPETSLALLKGDEVVGWLITHRFDSETIRVTCANIWPELRRGALMLPLIRELVQRQARETSFTRIIWATPVSMREMVLFEHYRMRPWLCSLGYACTAVRELASG
jgi:GNAT superfamily N-acetyltransferase